MIQRFLIENEKMNAFELTDFVIKKTGIVKELKKHGKNPALIRKYYSDHNDEHKLIKDHIDLSLIHI